MMAPYQSNMEDIDEPIIRGALYEANNGDLIRVRNVWVDEAMSTQVSIEVADENGFGGHDKETMFLQEFIEEINHSLFRVNSDHDAWAWRARVTER